MRGVQKSVLDWRGHDGLDTPYQETAASIGLSRPDPPIGIIGLVFHGLCGLCDDHHEWDLGPLGGHPVMVMAQNSCTGDHDGESLLLRVIHPALIFIADTHMYIFKSQFV